jgi:hypothetical protein
MAGTPRQQHRSQTLTSAQQSPNEAMEGLPCPANNLSQQQPCPTLQSACPTQCPTACNSSGRTSISGLVPASASTMARRSSLPEDTLVSTSAFQGQLPWLNRKMGRSSQATLAGTSSVAA